MLAFGVTSVATAMGKLQGNIEAVDVSDLVGDAPSPTSTEPGDPNAGKALNILLLGSDQRDGENAALGGEAEGMRSDTAIVMHISADRSRVELVSIPRDSLVDIPSCTMTDGTTTRARHDMFNSAFATGATIGKDIGSAAACSIKTVQSTTGVTINDYAVIDFSGFVKMVDALGGVSICIPNDMKSPLAGLDVKAGQQTLDGTTALAFARARKGTGVGDGSDTNRLGRQQRFLAAMATTILQKNLLTDATGLIRLLDAATESVTTSPSLASVTNLAGLGLSLKNISPDSISFMTIPFAAAASDRNRVEWTAEADTIWANMAADIPITATEPPVDDTAGAAAGTGAGTAADPTTPTPTGGATAGAPATAPEPTTVDPTPTATKQAGKEQFSAADNTGSCG
ncbi:LCP family protein [Cellulomonas sp. P22]|uniref:LCP family protein n=1 Tax=Cellulomonas sp. P22 TaxID=3373189 RepID=UPI00378C892D